MRTKKKNKNKNKTPAGAAHVQQNLAQFAAIQEISSHSYVQRHMHIHTCDDEITKQKNSAHHSMLEQKTKLRHTSHTYTT